MATPTNKTFDAVEMSRRLREETSRQLAALTPAERIALLNSHLRQPSPRTVRYPAEVAESCTVREEPPETQKQ
jgi:hypothetical protein